MEAVLLVNLGTPKTSAPRDVGVYLKEFLMDPYVIDIPWVARWILVNLLIVPRRSVASSKLYQKVWTEAGSPLLTFTQELTTLVKGRMGSTPVEMAMRYGEPSITSALARLREKSPTRITVLPLYPQYSLAATESSIQKIKAEVKRMGWEVELKFVPAFYDNAHYLDAVAKISRPHLEKFKWDKVLFSYHGLPERHVKKTDPTGAHCLVSENCCEVKAGANLNCYRHQCFETTKQLASRLGLARSQYEIGFQSRLGGTPWVKPYSDVWYEEFPKQNVKNLIVLTPSFVADCLETLEEVQLRGAEQFKAAGGKELYLVPSLNAEPAWADSVVKVLQSQL